MKDDPCPICKISKKERRFGGYCRECGRLVVNVNTKRRRGNIDIDRVHAAVELNILNLIRGGYKTRDIVRLMRGIEPKGE